MKQWCITISVYLGCYRGIYDEPRDVLSSFGTVVDAEQSRERSFLAAGGGDGLAFLGEERGKRVSVERAGQLRSLAPGWGGGRKAGESD